MKSRRPPDSHHLQAAEGWIGLDNYAEANDELEQIAAANRAHLDVLQLRWRIYAYARKWDACLDIATALTTMTPERRFGWIHRAHALDIGINDGAAAGQTVGQLHVHVIPRYQGDVPDPRGGVRFVIPGKARYWEWPRI